MSVYIKEAKQPAKVCIIWLHGLGANAQNMMGVADLLPHSLMPIRHVFMDAPVRPVTLNNYMQMRAWYDIIGLKLTDREDKAGISASETLINQVIDEQIDGGFNSKQIFLAGFSQGGAMALYTGLRASRQLGGLMSLSAYLPLASECSPIQRVELPIFMASGQNDPIVLPTWSKQSYNWLLAHDYNKVTWREYPMEHMISMNEIEDLSCWLNQVVEA